MCIKYSYNDHMVLDFVLSVLWMYIIIKMKIYLITFSGGVYSIRLCDKFVSNLRMFAPFLYH